jgi:threonine/homoserine/homoserine lactone efflux protein
MLISSHFEPAATSAGARSQATEVQTAGVRRRALCEGILIEALNPKTPAFFLALIPQFVDPTADAAAHFIILGLISVVRPR